MTQEQEKALKVTEKLISDMGSHTLSAEDIMTIIQGILSNDCGGCNWKYVQTPQYQPGLEPGKQPGYRPGEVWCGDHPKIDLYTTTCTNTTLDELPNHFKSEKEMIEEVRKSLEKNGDPIDSPHNKLIKNEWKDVGEKQPSICAGDNIPNMQYVIR